MTRWILALVLLFSMPAFVPVVDATVSVTPPRNDYIGTGSTATYSYTFKIFEATDLKVTVRDTAGVETELVYPTNYSVTGTGKASGGTVILTAGNLASGYTLTIRFDRVPKQSTDLRNQGSFFPETHESKFDELTRYAQQNRDVGQRSLRLPETEVGTPDATLLPVASLRASKFLAWDSSGNPIAAAGTSASLGPVSSFINTLLDDTDAATARATLGITALSTVDSDFRIKGSADDTKQLAFEVDGLTTGTTRTVTIPDKDGTLAMTSDTALLFSTGDVKLTLKTAADTGWVLMNDGTIGSASSGATTRANADTSDLYTLLWTNVTDQWAPVIGGRGASAAADFAANKPLRLPKTLGRALAGYGTGTVVASGVDGDVDIGAAESFTVASNNATWITGMPVVFTLSSGTITGLTSGNTYYIIRSSATLVQLASSLANAQNGTAINMTAKSSPVWTLTHTFTTRAMGEQAGEQEHAQNINELLAHTHVMNAVQNVAGAVAAAGGDKGATTNTGSRGGNTAMNNLQPTLFLNVMVKL